MSGTLVKTVNGYRSIETLAVGDSVISFDFDGKLCQSRIVQVSKKTVKGFVALQIGEKTVCTAPDQKFFLPEKGDWIKAKNVALSNRFLIKSDQASSALEIKLCDQTIDVYSISLDENHNFCITENDILVHNKMHKKGSGHHHHVPHNSHPSHPTGHNHPERNTTKVGNMHDWFKNHQTGQSVSGNLEKHPSKDDAWRAKDKIVVDNQKRMDKGDYIKLDHTHTHKDHFEHFDKGDNRKDILT